MDIEHQIAPQKCFILKTAFFQKNQVGIGPMWLNVVEIGQKMDFRALFSEIYIKIEVFTNLEPSYTSALIAPLAACLTFFI